ncbi:MAG: hypothetical protein AVDCRST_MAG67-1543, partial [uncultured Solirubrobacteraceae bacterium]
AERRRRALHPARGNPRLPARSRAGRHARVRLHAGVGLLPCGDAVLRRHGRRAARSRGVVRADAAPRCHPCGAGRDPM